MLLYLICYYTAKIANLISKTKFKDKIFQKKNYKYKKGVTPTRIHARRVPPGYAQKKLNIFCTLKNYLYICRAGREKIPANETKML